MCIGSTNNSDGSTTNNNSNSGGGYGGAQMGADIFGGLNKANQEILQGQIAKTMYDFQAWQYEQAAKAQQQQGKADIRELRKKVKSFTASQKAIMAANGMSLDSVTAEDINESNMSEAMQDELAIAYNTSLKVWENKTNASMAKLAGKNAERTGRINAMTSLAGTAKQMSEKKYKWDQTSAGSGNNSTG